MTSGAQQSLARTGLRLACLLVASFATLACGDEQVQPSGGGSSACDDGTPYDTYSAGLVAEGEAGALGVKLIDADPAPPGRGTNRWEVQLLDAAGAPLPSATITRVKPWMPDHGHGTGVLPEVGDIDGEGRAVVDELDFMMPGVWTVTFSLESSGVSDDATFAFCIDG